MKRLILLALLVAVAVATSFAATLPSVTVSSVTATSPVLRSTAEIDVSAKVTSTFDTDNTTFVTTTCTSNGGNNYCVTGDPIVTDQTVTTATIVTVGNTSTP